jgi:hypothetical protein
MRVAIRTVFFALTPPDDNHPVTNEREIPMNTTLPAGLRHGLRQKEAAAKLGVSLRTLQRWTRDGFGPQPYRDGASVLYDPAALAAFASGVRA